MDDLSPLAMAVLADHQEAPDQCFHDIAVFGSMFNKDDLEQLQNAYEELERAGLVEPTDQVARFFSQHVRLYRLVDLSQQHTEAA